MKRYPVLALLVVALLAGGALFWFRTGEDPDTAPSSAALDDPTFAPPGKRLVPGRWRKARRPETDLTPEQREKIEQLESIGYLAGSRDTKADRAVTVHEPDRAEAGYNLYTSGHFPGAILMDMDGREIHRWERRIETVWEGTDVPELVRLKDFWRRVHLYPNGDLLAIFEGVGIFKLDRDSELLWEARNGAHHDLEVLLDGDILVLTRKAHVLPRLHPTEPILEDFLTRLGPDGEERWSVSLIECLENSPAASVLADGRLGGGDILHTNTLFLLDGDHPDYAWDRPGAVLTSFRNIHALAVVDPERRTVLHTWAGPWRRQHDPQLLPNGNLLLFDNQGNNRGLSRVVEFHPETNARVWFYAGTDREPLESPTLGTSQRLWGGNTLITESDNGRALEVTPKGEVVWEFYNPHRVGENGEYIATVFDMIRLPADFPVGWAENAP